MKPGHGRADYLLYVDKAVVGVIEAKPEGTPLSGVEWQSAMYAEGLPAEVRLKALTVDGRLPFVFEAIGHARPTSPTATTPSRGPGSMFNFPKPSTLARILRDAEADPERPTWRAKVRSLPALDTAPLRPAQITAINGVEKSLAEQRFDRSLVQMATGAGKTYTAVTAVLPAAQVRRVQPDPVPGRPQQPGRPDAGGVPELPHARTTAAGSPRSTTSTSSPAPGCSARRKVAISTIQRVFKVLSNEDGHRGDDPGLDDFVPGRPGHRRLQPGPAAGDVRPGDRRRGPPLHLRRVARRAGVLRRPRRRPDRDPGQADLRVLPAEPRLASTPTRSRSPTASTSTSTSTGSAPRSASRARRSRPGRSCRRSTGAPARSGSRRSTRTWSTPRKQLDRAVTAKSQIRPVLETFRDRLFTEIFPGRSTVPKTLIFAKDDAHAEEIVTTVREVFGKGNDFAAKITYNARDPKGQLQAFRTVPTLRIAVTVDMIATGTDVKPLECVFFMRDVRSRAVLRADEGPRRPHHRRRPTSRRSPPTRRTRPGSSSSTPSASPSTTSSSRRSTGTSRSASRSCSTRPPPSPHRGRDRHPRLPAGRARARAHRRRARRARRASPASRSASIVRASWTPSTPTPRPSASRRGGEHPGAARRAPSSRSPPTPTCATASSNCARAHDRIIDEVSRDTLIDAHGVVDTEPRQGRRGVLAGLPRRAPRRDHRHPARSTRPGTGGSPSPTSRSSPTASPGRRTTGRPTSSGTPTSPSRRPRCGSSAAHTADRSGVAAPLHRRRRRRARPLRRPGREKYAAWLAQQEQAGVTFSDAERWWLDRMVAVIASSAGITADDLDDAPFTERGGIDGALRDLGDRAGDLIDELNAELTA